MSMRILFVLPRMWTGGVERVTLNLATAFEQQGIACRLALRKGEGELLAEAREILAICILRLEIDNFSVQNA